MRDRRGLAVALLIIAFIFVGFIGLYIAELT